MEFDLNTLWFFLITFLWMSYFFLEGFDFGVGILLPFLGRDDLDRRVMINTIGPVWDGNEVWLIVAGGATFAAFPEWYATLFSGFYLPLFLILVALILRGVAFEYRGKDKRPEWRAWWDKAIFFGSAVPALLWGVAFANIVRGVPIDAAGEYTGNLFTLLNPYALLGGVTTFVLFTLHGAVFLMLKTDGPVRERARKMAGRLAVPMAGLGLAFLFWTWLDAATIDIDGTDIAAGIMSIVIAVTAVVVILLLQPVPVPVPGSDAIHDGGGRRPRHLQRLVDRHDSESDVGGGADLHTPGDGLPGLVVLGVPRENHPGAALDT